MPASMAARMIDVPSGTEIGLPSMDTVTFFSAFDGGVP